MTHIRITLEVDLWFVTDFSGRPVGPIFKGQAVHCLTLEGVTETSVTN